MKLTIMVLFALGGCVSVFCAFFHDIFDRGESWQHRRRKRAEHDQTPTAARATQRLPHEREVTP